MDEDGFHHWAGQHGHLDHLTLLAGALPHPGIYHLQGCHLLICGSGKLHNPHHLSGVLSDVYCDAIWSGERPQVIHRNHTLTWQWVGPKYICTVQTVSWRTSWKLYSHLPFPWRQMSHIPLQPLSSQTSSKWAAITLRRHLCNSKRRVPGRRYLGCQNSYQMLAL